MRRIHFLLICFIISGFSEALSDDNPMISHAKPGFGMRPRAEAWSEVTVRISNPGGPKEVDVVIPCESPGVGSERVLCRRPVLLLSRDKAYEVRNAITVAEITTTIRKIAVEVELGKEDGMSKKCVINLDTIMTIPKNVLGERLTILARSISSG